MVIVVYSIKLHFYMSLYMSLCLHSLYGTISNIHNTYNTKHMTIIM